MSPGSASGGTTAVLWSGADNFVSSLEGFVRQSLLSVKPRRLGLGVQGG